MNLAAVFTMEELTLAESSRLIHLERVVTAGLQSWIEVGEALIEIRDSRLYKVEANTFEEYCQSRFKITRQRAHQLIGGAQVARSLSTTVDIPERAIREIAKVEPERRQEIFDKATEVSQGHTPTARVIKQVISLDEEEEEKAAIPVQTPKPSKLPKIVWDEAMGIAAVAKSHLECIHKNDISREKALKEIISYATKRLEEKR